MKKNTKRIFGFLLLTTIAFGSVAMINDDLLHTINQLFVVFIGLIVFVVAINSSVYSEKKLLLTIAVAYLYIATFDFLYMITLEQFDVVNKTTNINVQYWLSARILEAVILVVIYFNSKTNKVVNYIQTHFIFAVYAFVIVILIQFTNVLPPVVSNGEYTTIAYLLEGFIICILLIALFLINKLDVKKNLKRLISISIILKIVSTILLSYILKDFEIIHYLGHIIMLYSYVVIYFVFISETIVNPFHNVEAEYQDEKEELTYLAEHDQLTGIYNHTTTYKKVDEMIEEYKDTEKIAVILIDVDDFKVVNDTYGHLKGDVVLRAFAQMLLTCDAPDKVVGRYGGDEFIMACAGFTETEVIKRFEIIREKLLKLNEDLGIVFTFSAGVAFYTEDATTMDLIYKADIKMYEAKRLGKNQYVIW